MSSHICEVWQPENSIPPDHPPPYDEFLIETYITFMFVSNEEEIENSVTTPTTYNSFRQNRDHLVQDTTSWSTISNMLSQVNVPYHVQPFMIWKISKAARSIGGALENANLRSIPMVVLIRVVVQVSDLESLLRDSDIEEEPEKGVSNNKTMCLDGLGKVKVEEAESGNGNAYICVICLEEILVGTEAVSMPCSHVYHGNCIVDWLQRSQLCPLCRFRMLTGSGSKG